MKIALIILVVAVVAGGGYWIWSQNSAMMPAAQNSNPPAAPQAMAPSDDGTDKTASIEAAVNGTVVENPDADFQSVDADLKSL